VAELELTRIGLPTGVTLKVAFGRAGEPILFLHGFRIASQLAPPAP
jgi:hypothetical protein